MPIETNICLCKYILLFSFVQQLFMEDGQNGPDIQIVLQHVMLVLSQELASAKVQLRQAGDQTVTEILPKPRAAFSKNVSNSYWNRTFPSDYYAYYDQDSNVFIQSNFTLRLRNLC